MRLMHTALSSHIVPYEHGQAEDALKLAIEREGLAK
jgi:hypothetical protein